jgi:hypothetical protein
MLAEFYGNTITGADGARIVDHRGSCGLYFNNIITGSGSNKFDASQYGTTDNGGSGCNVDIQNIDPRAVTFNTQINNTYAWNNTGQRHNQADDAGRGEYRPLRHR